MHFQSLGDTPLMSVQWPKFTVGFFVSAYQCHLQYQASFETWFITLSVEVFLCQVQPGLSVGLCKNTSSLIFKNLMEEWSTESESHWLDLYLNQCWEPVLSPPLQRYKVVLQFRCELADVTIYKLCYVLCYEWWSTPKWKKPRRDSYQLCVAIICSICSCFLSNMPNCFPPPCPSFVGLSTVWSATWGLRG